MSVKKLFDHDPESFREMKKGKFYVIDKMIVFRQEDGVYFINQFRIGDLSTIDSFEEEYGHLELKYAFSGDLGGDDLQKIRKEYLRLPSPVEES